MMPVRIGALIDGNEGYGVLHFMRRLYQKLDRKLVSPVGIFLSPGPATDLVGPACDEVRLLGLPSLYPLAAPGHGRYYLPNLVVKGSAYWRAERATSRIIQELAIGVMHCSKFPHQMIAGKAAHHNGIRCVWHLHGAYTPTGLRDRLVRRALDRRADCLVTCSRFVQETLPAEERSKSRVVYNGVDAEAIRHSQRPGELRRRLGLSATEPLVGLFGAISPRKGHEYFIRAAARLVHQWPRARFVIVGGESESFRQRTALEWRLRTLAAELDLADKVLFAGPLDDAPRYMGDCDVICMPTVPIGRDLGEAFGLVTLEAMAAGAVVVATDCGGPPEVIEHKKTGLLVPPRDAEALAAACHWLLEDPQRRREIADAGWAHVRDHFDMSNTCRRMETIFSELGKRR